jgi:hypothetical protein
LLDEGLKGVRLANFTRIECAPKAIQQFAQQAVHLTSGKIFVENMFLSADRFFNAVDLTIDVDHKEMKMMNWRRDEKQGSLERK